MLDRDSKQPYNPLPTPVVQKDLWADLARPKIPKKKALNSLSQEQRDKLIASIDAKEFNDGQRALVRHVEGPLLGLAGAGSGKTHALTHRIARLVGSGVRPTRILAVTFTKKAADEMRDRTRKLLNGYSKKLPTIKTLHSLGFEIIRDNVKQFGYREEFRIINAIDSEQYLKRGLTKLTPALVNALGKNPVKALGEKISWWKNKGLNPEEVQSPYQPAYVVYQKWLKDNNRIDFDDLILLPVTLFRRRDGAEILKNVQNQYDHILVDEFQDVNPVQYDLLQLISYRSNRPSNLCVVGDDDQSIYEWRGADVGIIRTFTDLWAGSAVAKLEINYRSTPNILTVANNLMAASGEFRHDKSLRPHLPPGKNPTLTCCPDEFEEAKWIAQSISDSINSGRGPGDFAVLLRDQYKAKLPRIEEALADAKLPYKIWFTEDFKMGPTKQNAYSLLAAAHDPIPEESAFLQIFQSSRFTISARDLESLVNLRDNRTTPLWKVLSAGSLPGISSEGRKSIRAFHSLVESMHTRARRPGRHESLADIALSGFRELFPASTESELWNDPRCTSDDTVSLRTIIKTISAYENSVKTRNKSFSSYLHFQHVEIPRRIREGKSKQKANDKRNAISLMSIHGSKGLEFPVVFMPAFVEGVIPHEKACLAEELTSKKKQRMLIEMNEGPANSIEGERRLAYVGMTRAQAELWISFPETFSFRGRAIPQKVSRFAADSQI